MVAHPLRSVGPADFHDGLILLLFLTGDEVWITVQGASEKHYEVWFEGVQSLESKSPEGMVLYALCEKVGESPSPLRNYEFVNWYCDEPSDQRSSAYLRIAAKSFTIKTATFDR